MTSNRLLRAVGFHACSYYVAVGFQACQRGMLQARTLHSCTRSECCSAVVQSAGGVLLATTFDRGRGCAQMEHHYRPNFWCSALKLRSVHGVILRPAPGILRCAGCAGAEGWRALACGFSEGGDPGHTALGPTAGRRAGGCVAGVKQPAHQMLRDITCPVTSALPSAGTPAAAD